jgi:hypothetical protein
MGFMLRNNDAPQTSKINLIFVVKFNPANQATFSISDFAVRV